MASYARSYHFDNINFIFTKQPPRRRFHSVTLQTPESEGPSRGDDSDEIEDPQLEDFFLNFDLQDLDADITLLGEYLENCEQLKVAPCNAIVEFLKKLKAHQLQLAHYGLKSNGVKAYTSVALTVSSLNELDLEDNCLGPAGLHCMLHYLKNNYYVTYVNLSHNHLGNDGAKLVSKVLKFNICLRSVKLSNNGINDLGAAYIGEGMSENSNLKELWLDKNAIGSEGFPQALIEGIQESPKLELLDLSWNQIRATAATVLLVAVKNHGNIVDLNVSHNGLTDMCANLLGDILVMCTTLKGLNVSACRLQHKTAVSLARGLMENTGLVNLHLDSNALGDKSYLLLDALVKNPNSKVELLSLRRVDVDDRFMNTLNKLDRSRVKVYYGKVVSSLARTITLRIESDKKPVEKKSEKT